MWTVGKLVSVVRQRMRADETETGFARDPGSAMSVVRRDREHPFDLGSGEGNKASRGWI